MKPIIGFADLWWARFGTRPPVLPKMTGTPLIGGMLKRSTCRSFRPDRASEGLLNLVLACAQSAPSKSDLQQYSIIVVEDPEKRKAFNAWSSFDPWVAKAPHLFIFCGDIRRQQSIAALRDKKYRNNTIDAFTNAVTDASLALAFAIAAVESTGLGCCPLSTVRNHLDDAKKLFALPDGVFPLAGLLVGLRAEKEPRTLRLPPEVVIHRDSYDETDLWREIDRYDERRHSRRPIPKSKHRMTDRYGPAERYTWSEDSARRMSETERANFLEFLKEQGFALE